MTRPNQTQEFLEQPSRVSRLSGGRDVPQTPSNPAAPVAHVAAVSGFLTCNTVAQKVMTANKLRAYLFFQNQGTDTIWLGIGTAPQATAGFGLQLAPGAVYEPNTNGRFLFFNDVYAVTTAGSQQLFYVEGSYRDG